MVTLETANNLSLSLSLSLSLHIYIQKVYTCIHSMCIYIYIYIYIYTYILTDGIAYDSFVSAAQERTLRLPHLQFEHGDFIHSVLLGPNVSKHCFQAAAMSPLCLCWCIWLPQCMIPPIGNSLRIPSMGGYICFSKRGCN